MTVAAVHWMEEDTMIDEMKAAAERLRAVPVPPARASKGLDVVALWPDLFEGMDEGERNSFRQTFASNWHEGWEPNRADVADLVAHVQGRLSDEEYLQRGVDRVRAARRRAAS